MLTLYRLPIAIRCLVQEKEILFEEISHFVGAFPICSDDRISKRTKMYHSERVYTFFFSTTL